jgi:hypothetical protein
MNIQSMGGSLMSSLRRTITCLLAMLALSAVAASSAAAASPAWWVTGSLLKEKSTAAIAETTTVITTFSFTTPTVGLQCGAISAESAFIEGEKTAKAKSIVFKNCKAIKPTTCSIPASDETLPLTATLEGTSKHFKLNFAPTTGKVLAEIEFSGASCSLTGIKALEGTMACNYPGVETESVDHLLEFTATSGSLLKLVGEEAVFTGLDEFWLVSKSKWSVH